MEFWNTETEKTFFLEALKNFSSPEQLFYKLKSDYYAYVPKAVEGEGQTLQSRNSLIGQFTEKWTKDLFSPLAREMGLFAVNSVVCDEIALSNRSNADLAFCTTDSINQKPENIKVLFEIKMSIVSNYKYTFSKTIEYVDDYKSHKGTPSLLRSDSMLKAIGKAINIRVSGMESAKIPIIVLGNSPITDSYSSKIDFLKKAGVIQGFWSLNPTPSKSAFISETLQKAFQTISSYSELKKIIEDLLTQELNYFSSMLPKSKLGELISIAAKQKTNTDKAEKFLELVRNT